MLKRISDILKAMLDFLAPRHCSVCEKRLHLGEEGICISCLLELRLTEYADGRENNQLERIFWKRLPIERAAAFLVYNRESAQRQIVLDLKFHNRPTLGFVLAPIMVQKLRETNFFDGIDLIVPIPIPTRRQIDRGYNQSMQIAKGVSRETNIPIENKLLKRRYYKSQSQTNLFLRRENVKDTFILRSNDAVTRLAGKHILIVDDVITTESTILSCAEVLLQIPQIRLSILSLAVSKNLINNLRHTNPIDPSHSFFHTNK